MSDMDTALVSSIPQKEREDLVKTPNPLEIEVVLLTLVKVLDFEELKSARLVSKKWNELAWPVFKETATVHFKGNGLYMSPEDTEAEAKEQISRFQANNTEIPMRFCKFHIHNLAWLAFKSFREWMSVYGQSMRELVLGDNTGSFYGTNEMNDHQLPLILRNWCPNLVRFDLRLMSMFDQLLLDVPDLMVEEAVRTGGGSVLESLSIKQTSSYNEEGFNDIGNISRLAVQHSPNLKALSITGYEFKTLSILFRRNDEHQGSIRSTLEGLETLDLHGQVMTLKQARELEKFNFTDLKMLGIGVIGAPADPGTVWSVLTQILGKVAHSLGHLSFGNASIYSDYEHVPIAIGNIPLMMPKINTFVNHDIRHWKLKLGFVSSFPNLEFCSLLCSCSTDQRLRGCSNGDRLFDGPVGLELNPHMELQSLVMNCPVTTLRNVGIIVHAFPNLNKLHINIGLGYNDPEAEHIGESLEILAGLKRLERLWIRTDGKWVNEHEDAVKTSILAIPAIKSVVIEGGHYLYLKMEGSVEGLKSDWNQASRFKGLFPLLQREFEMDPVELEWLTGKFYIDLLVFKMMD